MSMSEMDIGSDGPGDPSIDTQGSVRPRVPVSSITSFGEGLGLAGLQSLGRELEAESEGEQLAFPFSSKMFDAANAALFFAHNGRLDAARQQLQAGNELVSTELKGVDDGFPKEGTRHDRVSLSVEQFVKAKAFVHFLETGRLLRKGALEGYMSDSEYLGAVMGLTSELARYAITQASALDRDSIHACATLCHELFGELVQFDLRNGPLRKRFDGVKYDVRKIDDILYELSLVGADGGKEAGEVEKEAGESGPGRKRAREPVNGALVDRKELGGIREAMVAFDEQREAVIKRTRDIQKWSKMSIYSLHRGDSRRAAKQLSDCQKAAAELLPVIQGTPQLRQGAFSGAMEEFAEARLYEVWLKERRLAPREEVGIVDTEEYMGGLFDLTGELNRFAVARATERDTEGVKECLETVLVIHEFVTLNSVPQKVARKRKELNISLRKLQNMTYELALMKAGKGKVAGVSGLDEEPPSAGKEERDD